MRKARNFKLGILIDLGMSQLMDDKIPAKWGHGSLAAKILNFGTPSLNLERIKLETSNLVYG